MTKETSKRKYLKFEILFWAKLEYKQIKNYSDFLLSDLLIIFFSHRGKICHQTVSFFIFPLE